MITPEIEGEKLLSTDKTKQPETRFQKRRDFSRWQKPPGEKDVEATDIGDQPVLDTKQT